jgi:hypothetical protein
MTLGWPSIVMKGGHGLMFFLVDDHGSPLGEFKTREEATAALEELIVADPQAAEDCAIIELDARGRRVGEPITRTTPVSA